MSKNMDDEVSDLLGNGYLGMPPVLSPALPPLPSSDFPDDDDEVLDDDEVFDDDEVSDDIQGLLPPVLSSIVTTLRLPSPEEQDQIIFSTTYQPEKRLALLSSISKDLMQETFEADVIKDSHIQPSVDNEHLDNFKKACGHNTSAQDKSTQDKSKAWDKPFDDMEELLEKSGRKYQVFANLLKGSTSKGTISATQILNPEQYEYVGYDTGPHGSTVFINGNLPEIICTVASMMDTASADISTKTFWPPLNGNPNVPHTLIIEKSVCERLGLPKGSEITIVTTKTQGGNSHYDYTFKSDMFQINATLTSPDVENNSEVLKKYLVGNKKKNKEINSEDTPQDDRNKYLLFKELSDILTILIFFIFLMVDHEPKDGIVLSVDKIVLLRCMFFNLACLCTGIRKKVRSGHATYYYYSINTLPFKPEQVKEQILLNIEQLYDNILGHNLINMFYLSKLQELLSQYVNSTKFPQFPEPKKKLLGYYYILVKKSSVTKVTKKKPTLNKKIFDEIIDLLENGSELSTGDADFFETRLSHYTTGCYRDLAGESIELNREQTIEIIEQILRNIQKVIDSITTNCIKMIRIYQYWFNVIKDATDTIIPTKSGPSKNPSSKKDIAHAIDKAIQDAIQDSIKLKRALKIENIIKIITELLMESPSVSEDTTALWPDPDLSDEQTKINSLMNNPNPVPEEDNAKQLIKQIEYINEQSRLADLLRNFKCKQEVTVVDKTILMLNNPKNLLNYHGKPYKINSYMPTEIGENTLINIESILSNDEDAVDVDAAMLGGAPKKKAVMAEKAEKAERSALKRSAIALGNIPNKRLAIESEPIESEPIEPEPIESEPYSFAVDPMCVILCSAAIKCYEYGSNINITAENESEKLEKLMKIFYDVLAEKVTEEELYKLAKDLINNYELSEEEINIIGSKYESMINYESMIDSNFYEEDDTGIQVDDELESGRAESGLMELVNPVGRESNNSNSEVDNDNTQDAEYPTTDDEDMGRGLRRRYKKKRTFKKKRPIKKKRTFKKQRPNKKKQSKKKPPKRKD